MYTDDSNVCRINRFCEKKIEINHGFKMKFIVRPCGETRRPHASPPRIITGRSSARTGLRFGRGWRRRPGRPRHSWIQQVGDGIHPSAFVPNGPRLVVVATLG